MDDCRKMFSRHIRLQTFGLSSHLSNFICCEHSEVMLQTKHSIHHFEFCFIVFALLLSSTNGKSCEMDKQCLYCL